MPKYEYEVEEILKYRRTIVLETELEEETMLNVLEDRERRSDTAEDLADSIQLHPDINVVEYPDSDTSSPMDTEVEYWDHREVEDD